MSTSASAAAPQLPLPARMLTAGAVTAGCGAIVVVLFAYTLVAWADGNLASAVALPATGVALLAAAGALWHHLLPPVRWMGVPVTLGLATLLWDLLVPFLLG